MSANVEDYTWWHAVLKEGKMSEVPSLPSFFVQVKIIYDL